MSNEYIERLEEWLRKVDEKLQSLDSRVDSVDKTIIKQEENLKHHMYRTELLEQQTKVIVEELKPIKKQYSLFDASFKIIGIVATGAGIIAGIISALSKT